jgi:hypothetical protein
MKARRVLYALLCALFAGVLVFLVFCKKGMPEPGWMNHENGALRVYNELQQRLLFFKGVPSRKNYIGGVPGKTNDFGLIVPAGEWLITAVKVEDYMLNRSDVKNMPVSLSRALVIGKEPVALTVNSLLSGEGRVRFTNNTDSFIEIRMGSFTGTNAATLAPRSSRLQHLPCWDFTFYPVRLLWTANAGGVAGFQEIWLEHAAYSVALYPDDIPEVTIGEERFP